MADGDGIPPAAVINLVFFALLFNVVVMALSFAVVSGYATLRGYPFGDLFGAAAGFLGLVATFMALLRSALVALLDDLAS